MTGVPTWALPFNIRKTERQDPLVSALADGAPGAGGFPQKPFFAAPVLVSPQDLGAWAAICPLLANTGNANAGTGNEGLKHARQTCADLARLLGCEVQQILPFSTGVIMEPLPVARVAAGLPACIADLKADNWFNAATAIMTTDTLQK